MSVLINGMDMPENCDVCMFSDWSNLHQTASCKICEYDPCFDDFSREHLSKRANFCPLVEILPKRGRSRRMNDLKDLKPCPFCGKEVKMIKDPLWHGSHGYYGCYQYIIKCENPECRCEINLGQNDTIYCDDETAQKNAIKAWNRRVKDE